MTTYGPSGVGVNGIAVSVGISVGCSSVAVDSTAKVAVETSVLTIKTGT